MAKDNHISAGKSTDYLSIMALQLVFRATFVDIIRFFHAQEAKKTKFDLRLLNMG